MIGPFGCRRLSLAYTLAEDASPPTGAVKQAFLLTLSLTDRPGVVVLRMVGVDGRELHWPMTTGELAELVDGLDRVHSGLRTAPPFKPGRFRNGASVG